MLTIVTWNTGKFQEISQVLEWIDLLQRDIDIEEIQTPSLEKISLDKCKKAFVEVWWPVLVDDSGIYFDSLNQFPWALAKFFIAWVWAEGIQRMYQWVENNWAEFVSVLSYMDETLSEPIQFIWKVHGSLVFDYIHEENPNPKLPYLMFFQADWMSVPASLDRDERRKNHNFRMNATKKFKERYLSK